MGQWQLEAILAALNTFQTVALAWIAIQQKRNGGAR